MTGRGVEGVLFRHEIGRYLLSRFFFRYARPLWSTRMAPLDPFTVSASTTRRGATPPEALPAGWVRLRIRLCGICGTDLAVITGRDSLYLEPEATYPFVPGHEIVAEVARDQDVPANSRNVKAGDRVAVWSPLGCATRGEDLPCGPCSSGWDGLCEKRNGARWPGAALAIGFSRETGGGWSRECLAHVSQLWPLPDAVDDSDALLLDPAATALGSLLREGGEAMAGRTLVIGGGTIGLLCMLLARALDLPGSHELLVRHESQRQWAAARGLTVTLARDEREFLAWGATLGMHRRDVPGYGAVVRGTFDRVIDAAGTLSSLRWAIASVRTRGELVLATSPITAQGIDPTPLWYREIRCRGVNGYGPVRWDGRRMHPYELLLPRLAAGSVRLRDLHTHTFPIREFRRAVRTALQKQSGAIKVALAPGENGPWKRA